LTALVKPFILLPWRRQTSSWPLSIP